MMQGDLVNMGAIPKEPLSEHTTFQIGGAADYFISPSDIDSFKDALILIRQAKLPYFILGNGSNLLVHDKGYRGVVLSTKKLTRMSCKETVVVAEAGVSLKDAADYALQKGLSGLEFACGIPGSVGGAVFMNAGAYGGEIKNIVERVEAVNAVGETRFFSAEECEFGTRKSFFQNTNWVILSVHFRLVFSNVEGIDAKMREYTEMRTSKQPLEYGSAGSVFKRPEGHYAGKLIEDAGLKGLRYRNAEISSKHSGFIVNLGGATSEEVLTLIRLAQKVVSDRFGITLEREVRLLGYED